MTQPIYRVLPHLLDQSDLDHLRSLTEHEPADAGFGRERFWPELFRLGDHAATCAATPTIDKVARIFLRTIRQLGYYRNIPDDEILFDVCYDRVTENEPQKQYLPWHNDSMILSDGSRIIPSFSMVLMMSQNEGEWSGGDLMLQKGGHTEKDEGDPTPDTIRGCWHWVNSDHPVITFVPRYNQAIVFKNDECGHRVTPIHPTDRAVREVFLLCCHRVKDCQPMHPMF